MQPRLWRHERRRTLFETMSDQQQTMKLNSVPEPEFCLFHSDCVAGMRQIQDASVDVVVTSPPYNLGIDYSTYDDKQSRVEYLKWTLEWASEVKRTLKPDGSFFLNVGAAPANPMMPHEIILILGDFFVLQNTIHWIKSISIKTRAGQTISTGHFKPLNSKRYLTDCHEYIFHLTKTGTSQLDRLAIGVPYADKTNINRWAHSEGVDKRCRGNTWFIPYQTIKNRAGDRPHPATFPVELPLNCVGVRGNVSTTVMMDPFLGIGHSALAAREAGVQKFIGFELDRGYIETAMTSLGLPLTEIKIPTAK